MMTYHFSNWSKILKTHRESQSYSLLELSNKTGVSRNTLIELEKGSKNIQEFQKNAEFVRITSAGSIESHPHDMNITKDSPNYRNTNLK